MHKVHFIMPVVLVSVFAFMTGCGGRDVEVTGEAKSAATVDGPISIEFFSVPAEGDSAEPESLAKLEIEKLGSFKQTVSTDGDEIRVRALADKNKDGACSEGEAWAETTAKVKDDGTVDPLTLELAATACPKADAPAK